MTPFPTKSPESVAASQTCNDIQSGVKPQSLEGEAATLYTVTITLEYERPPLLRDGVVSVFDEVSTVVDLWVGGCEVEADEVASTMREELARRRRLQGGTVFWVDSTYAPSGVGEFSTQDSKNLPLLSSH
jgi:hypothetical protein